MEMTKKMNIVMMKISDIKEYENNPRKNDDAVDAVASSIKSFGFKVPVIVDSNNVIIAGHTRVKACKKLGITEVPCVIADDLTEDQIKAFRLADNKVSEKASWNIELLSEELEDLDLDMDQFGFEIDDDFIDDYLDEKETKDINKHLLKCPACGHVNEEKAFKNYEDTE